MLGGPKRVRCSGLGLGRFNGVATGADRLSARLHLSFTGGLTPRRSQVTRHDGWVFTSAPPSKCPPETSEALVLLTEDQGFLTRKGSVIPDEEMAV